MRAQGWFVDPFQTHDARWISDGRPTALVRDGNTESADPPPAGDFRGPLLPFDQSANQAVTPLRQGFWGKFRDVVLKFLNVALSFLDVVLWP